MGNTIDRALFARVVAAARSGMSVTVAQVAAAAGTDRDTAYRHLALARDTGVDLDPDPAPPVPANRDTSVDWRHRALCRDENPELFFPAGTTGPAERQVEEAKAVCRHCPVTSDCLTWALETGQDAGVWGGTTEDERRALKRAQMRARAKAATS